MADSTPTPEPTATASPEVTTPSGPKPEGACPAPGENAPPGSYPTCGVIPPGTGNDGALTAISHGSTFFGVFLFIIVAAILARMAFKRPRPSTVEAEEVGYVSSPGAPTTPLSTKAAEAVRAKGWYPLPEGDRERHWNGEKWTSFRKIQASTDAVNLAEERLSPEEAQAILEQGTSGDGNINDDS